MIHCPECLTRNRIDALTCEQCGFKFTAESAEEQAHYFNSYRKLLENAYTRAETPWAQSGKGGRYMDWARGRMPIAEAVTHDGSFLDIGCANGYLLECLLGWLARDGISITPFGLDYAAETLTLAKQRLPEWADNLHLGNAWDWPTPQRFDHVRTELVYVPLNLRLAYLQRLMAEFLAPGGSLLVCEYNSRSASPDTPWETDLLPAWGYPPVRQHSGYSNNGGEICRVLVLEQAG